jgi:hypothetical protein
VTVMRETTVANLDRSLFETRQVQIFVLLIYVFCSLNFCDFSVVLILLPCHLYLHFSGVKFSLTGTELKTRVSKGRPLCFKT